MTIEEAIGILEYHNKWRRSESDFFHMVEPKILGEAIDKVVSYFKETE